MHVHCILIYFCQALIIQHYVVWDSQREKKRQAERNFLESGKDHSLLHVKGNLYHSLIRGEAEEYF